MPAKLRINEVNEKKKSGRQTNLKGEIGQRETVREVPVNCVIILLSLVLQSDYSHHIPVINCCTLITLA